MRTVVIRDEAWILPDFVDSVPGATPAVSRCRSCNAEILWVITLKGRRAPLNRDGLNHFATCPQAKAWKRT